MPLGRDWSVVGAVRKRVRAECDEAGETGFPKAVAEIKQGLYTWAIPYRQSPDNTFPRELEGGEPKGTGSPRETPPLMSMVHPNTDHGNLGSGVETGAYRAPRPRKTLWGPQT